MFVKLKHKFFLPKSLDFYLLIAYWRFLGVTKDANTNKMNHLILMFHTITHLHTTAWIGMRKTRSRREQWYDICGCRKSSSSSSCCIFPAKSSMTSQWTWKEKVACWCRKLKATNKLCVFTACTLIICDLRQSDSNYDVEGIFLSWMISRDVYPP